MEATAGRDGCEQLRTGREKVGDTKHVEDRDVEKYILKCLIETSG